MTRFPQRLGGQASDCALGEKHPRLLKKCRELLSETESLSACPLSATTRNAGSALAALIVATAGSEGRAVIAVDGRIELRIPRHIRRLKLHRLMGLPAAHAN